jgi:hypothetical protein
VECRESMAYPEAGAASRGVDVGCPQLPQGGTLHGDDLLLVPLVCMGGDKRIVASLDG